VHAARYGLAVTRSSMIGRCNVEPLVAGALAGVVLLVLWWGANRRHLRRREPQSADWDGAEGRPELWTSGARCPHCSATGGLLDDRDGELWFTCLACGQRHRREHRA
jgi:hypothetical protein